MTNHPFHVHGIEFELTGTDGGPVPVSARWPEVTQDIAVGQMRQIEFIADEPGDWAVHCHKSHHTMGAMGHEVTTMIGINHQGLVGRLQKVVPDYMVMGERGMYDMKEMEMELPPNTIPMMAGTGPYGPIGMGGMFTTLKVREDLKPNDYSDPGWYKQPPGTQAYEYKGTLPAVNRNNNAQSAETPAGAPVPPNFGDGNAQVRKPSPATSGSHQH
jgi:hypothetical protein